MFNRENYEYLRKNFGSVSSWAIWSIPENPTDKKLINDLSMFDKEKIDETLKTLNNNYVLVGLNAAEHDINNLPADWSNFHSNDISKQKDYKLRYALMNTPFWGSYITDIIKWVRLTKSEKLGNYLKNNPDIEKNLTKNLPKS